MDINSKKPKHPYIDFYPTDKKTVGGVDGNKPPSQQTLDPNSARRVGDPKTKKVLSEKALDRIRKRQIMLYRVDETLHPSDKALEYINKFVSSNDTALECMDEKKRIQLALAAYYSNTLSEQTNMNSFQDTLEEFLSFAASYIGINEMPQINLKHTPDYSPDATTFGTYSPSEKTITLSVTNRHPMDVFRSLAHELVHHKQNEDEVLHNESGQTGSEHENEANSLAGVIMRDFAKTNPHYFELESIVEGRRSNLMGRLVKHVVSHRKAAVRAADKEAKDHAKAQEKEQKGSFEGQVNAKIDREKVRAEAKKRMSDEAQAKSSKKMAFGAYASSVTGAAQTRSPSARKDYIDKIRHHAKSLKDKGVTVHPAKDLNLIRKASPKVTKDPNRKPPAVLAEEPAVVVVKTNKNPRGYRKVFPSQQHAADWKMAQLRKGTFGRKIELRETLALMHKSKAANIPYEVIHEIYQRGLADWTPASKLTREQFGFNRVNSFIAGGKARQLDEDLIKFFEE